ncbi:hypothetical protein [Leifsonia sp. NCR5]|uniref:hypothetical protein n=1 Tax=Leifsonia sp. NCR5 TaxID=1978342 RepID=UPI000A199230|nr:hypothetical protein [Leifsonia sp. NCR5]
MAKARRSLWIVVVAVGTALALGVGITALVLVIGARAAATPQAVVSTYLADVKRGDVEAATKLEGRQHRSADVLLTNKAYKNATDRVTGYRILGVRSHGRDATVTAEVTGGGKTTTRDFAVRRDAWTPASMVGVDGWKLAPVTLGTVTVTIGAPGRVDATLAGVPLGWKGATLRLNAFPGTYTLTAGASTDWFTLAGAKATVAGFGADAQLRDAAVLTPKGLDAAKAAAQGWLDGCAASQDAQPAGCSFGLSSGAEAGEVWTNAAWTIQSRPELTVGPWDFGCHLPDQADVSAGGCWPVKTATPGTVTFHADFSFPATGDSGTITSTAPIEADVEGSVSSFGDAGAVFQSVTWGPGSSSEGS